MIVYGPIIKSFYLGTHHHLHVLCELLAHFGLRGVGGRAAQKHTRVVCTLSRVKLKIK